MVCTWQLVNPSPTVTPAKAGVQWLSADEEPAPDSIRDRWIPAFAGMTPWGKRRNADSRLRNITR